MQTEEAEFRMKNENQELNSEKITSQSAAFNICSCNSQRYPTDHEAEQAWVNQNLCLVYIASSCCLRNDSSLQPSVCRKVMICWVVTIKQKCFLGFFCYFSSNHTKLLSGFTALKRSSEDETVDVHYCLCK